MAEWFRSAGFDQSSGNEIGCYSCDARRKRSRDLLSVVANRRINPNAPTSILHAGLSSTRYLESRDGLRRRRLRVRNSSARTGEIQSGLTTPTSSGSGPLEHRRGLWGGYQLGVCAIPQLCLSLVEGGRHRFELCGRLYLAVPQDRMEGLID